MQDIMITPGTFFDGYVATQYFNPISHEVFVRVHVGEISNPEHFGHKIETLLSDGKESAINTLKDKAKALGADAILGYSCQYLSFDPRKDVPFISKFYAYMICIFVQGVPVKLKEQK